MPMKPLQLLLYYLSTELKLSVAAISDIAELPETTVRELIDGGWTLAAQEKQKRDAVHLCGTRIKA